MNRLVIFAAFGIVAAILAVDISTQSPWLEGSQRSESSKPDASNIQTSGSQQPAIQAEASEKEVWEELGLPYDPNEGEPTELTAEDLQQAQIEQALEEELLRIDAKEGTTFSRVMEDGRIKEQVKGALQVSVNDFLASENRQDSDLDKITLTVTGDEFLEGSKETSYTSILTGMFALEIETKDGAIVSIERKPLDDIRTVFTYRDEEKEFIRMALNDPAVQDALKEKEDAGIPTVVSIRGKISSNSLNCPLGQCALMTIREVNSHATLAILLNTEEGKVVQTKQVEGW